MTHQEFDYNDIEDNRGVSAAAYFIFFLPLIMRPDSAFAKFHCNQGLNLFIAAFLGNLFRFVPFLGWLISSIIGLIVLIIAIYGAVKAWNGKAEPLPLIGEFRLIP